MDGMKSCWARSKDREYFQETSNTDRGLVGGLWRRKQWPVAPAESKDHVNDGSKDKETNDREDNRDGDLGTSAERWCTTVNGVARMAVRFLRRICASFQ
jgi:hypothetical protein